MWIYTFIIIILLCVPRGGDDDDHDRCKHIKCVHIFFLILIIIYISLNPNMVKSRVAHGI